MSNKTVRAYRTAAKNLWNISDIELETYIIDPKDDAGEWAPNAKVIIYLEKDCRRKGDLGIFCEMLDYYNPTSLDNAWYLSEKVGDGSYIEFINAAVAAVY